MIAVFGAGEVLKIVFSGSRNESRAGWLKAGWYFSAAAASVAASLVNPYTYRLLRHVISYLGTSSNWQNVVEYLSPNFHGPTAVPFEAMLVLAAAAIYRDLSKGRFTEPLLLLLWVHAALLAQRNIAIFAVIAAVPVGRTIQECLDELPRWNVAGWVRQVALGFNRLAARAGEMEAVGRWHLVSVAGLLMVAAVIWAPNPPKAFRAEFDPDRYPAGALATLRGDPSARIFTDDEWGDYLIWSLYPSQKVFVDGRDDFYGDDFEEAAERHSQGEVRLGAEPGPIRRRHDFTADQRAAGRRAAGIQPLAPGVRGRRRPGIPIRGEGGLRNGKATGSAPFQAVALLCGPGVPGADRVAVRLHARSRHAAIGLRYGWHIRTGEWIFAHHGVPWRDIFSFSKSSDPWYAWEWLSDVVFAALNGLGGLRAVVLFSVLLLSLTFTLLFKLVRKKSNAIVAIAITVMAADASSLHWLARPHLFTLLFVVLFYAALERVREGNERLAGVPYLAILPVATVLWTNLHGGFFLGILMIAIYGAGEVLGIVLCGERSACPGSWPKAGRYFSSALACLAASLINPYGYRLHAHIAAYLGDPFNSRYIQEFLSPNFHMVEVRFFEILLVLAAAAGGWNLSRGRFTEPLLLAMLAQAALLAVRNVSIFAIVAAVPVAGAIEEWLDRLPEWNVAGWLRKAAERFNHVAVSAGKNEAAAGGWCLVSAASLLVVAALTYAPNPPAKFRAEFDPRKYPSGALATLRRDPSARIFADDEWGDYLIWRLYPAHRVFVDGRSDFYGHDFEEKYIDVLNVKYGWEKILGDFGVDTILLPMNAPLAGALRESSRWRLVFDDGVALVFRPAGKDVPPQDQGAPGSVAQTGNGRSRDREVTKTEARDRAITETKFKT